MRKKYLILSAFILSSLVITSVSGGMFTNVAYASEVGKSEKSIEEINNEKQALRFIGELNDLRKRSDRKPLTPAEIAKAQNEDFNRTGSSELKPERIHSFEADGKPVEPLKVHADLMKWAQTRAEELAANDNGLSHSDMPNGAPDWALVEINGRKLSSLINNPKYEGGKSYFGPENLAYQIGLTSNYSPIQMWYSELSAPKGNSRQGYGHYLTEVTPLANLAGLGIAKSKSGSYFYVLEIAYGDESKVKEAKTVEEALAALDNKGNNKTDSNEKPDRNKAETPELVEDNKKVETNEDTESNKDSTENASTTPKVDIGSEDESTENPKSTEITPTSPKESSENNESETNSKDSSNSDVSVGENVDSKKDSSENDSKNELGNTPDSSDKEARTEDNKNNDNSELANSVLVDKTNGIKLELSKEDADRNLKLNIASEKVEDVLSRISDESIKTLIETKSKAGKVKIFDIHLTDENSKVQPNGKVIITMKHDGDVEKVYHLSDKGIEEVKFEKDGENVKFTVSHFSSFIFVEKDKKTNVNSTNVDRKGGPTANVRDEKPSNNAKDNNQVNNTKAESRALPKTGVDGGVAFGGFSALVSMFALVLRRKNRN